MDARGKPPQSLGDGSPILLAILANVLSVHTESARWLPGAFFVPATFEA